MSTRAANDRRTKLTALLLVGVVGGMVGLSFAAVPLYQWFCQVTGFGGTPQVVDSNDSQISDKKVTVRFDANVNGKLPWRFRPDQTEMTVRIGEQVLAHYYAENTSDKPVVGTATFNVAPYKAAGYFLKTDCFCFTEQRLEPGQKVHMPVAFYVDPEILSDKHADDVKTITLSYTFFEKKTEGQGKEGIESAAVDTAR